MKICNHTIESARQHLRFSLAHIVTGIFIGVAIFTISRFVFISTFSTEAMKELTALELRSFFMTGFLFDIKYAALTFLPAIAFALLLCFRQRFATFFKKYLWCYETLAFLWVVIISIINLFYFKTYNRFIDAFIFSIFKEDPVAVITTVINDYPIFLGSLLVVICTAIYMLVIRRWVVYLIDKILFIPKNKYLCFGLVFCLVFILVLIIRGSLGTFPLRQNDYQVTRFALINNAVPNGHAAFAWAYKWYSKQGKIPRVTKEDIISSWRGLGLQATNEDLFKPLKRRTATNQFLATHKPNVVFALMESMSSHMLSYDNDNFDVYGALRSHAQEDFFFLNFVSEGNGTIDSLTRLLLASPDMDLSTSSNNAKTYLTNVLRPFKAQGYKAIFITSGAGSWRNINNFLKAQGFDEVIEKNSIRVMFPEATEGTWGIDDEYLFKAAELVLSKQQQPVVLFLLSITNHPPYRVPENDNFAAPRVTKEISARFPYAEAELQNIFGTFSYANNALGNFITDVKKDSRLANSTIIAATGDHNLRGIGYAQYPAEAVLGHAVPFYLYIPQSYRDNQVINYDKQRFGSHKDIFTTITEHALSDAGYYSFGCDLLATTACNFPYAFNSEIVVDLTKDDYYACIIGSEEFAFSSISLLGPRANSQERFGPYSNGVDTPFIYPLIAEPATKAEYNCQKAKALIEVEQQLFFYETMHNKELQ